MVQEVLEVLEDQEDQEDQWVLMVRWHQEWDLEARECRLAVVHPTVQDRE